MDEFAWYEFGPSLASAIAAIGAAVAAFISLKISRDARRVAEQNALATHHGQAAEVLSQSVDEALEALEPLTDVVHAIHVQWPSMIQQYDSEDLGGDDPRPLRHVLSEIGEMVFVHSTRNGKNIGHAVGNMFSVVRDAPPIEKKNEWEQLLSKADHTYSDFSNTFGEPDYGAHITQSNAFRWAFFQLHHRVADTRWLKIWNEAWTDGGVITKYFNGYTKALVDIERVHKDLVREKKRIAYSAIPLEKSKDLSAKYNEALSIFRVFREDCSLEILELYKNEKYKDFAIPLVVFLIAVSVLIRDLYNKLYGISVDI